MPYGTSTTGSSLELHARNERRIASFGPGGEAANGCTYTRGRAAADTGRGRDDVPSRPEDGHAVGQGRKADIHPHARWAPPVPGDRSPRTARRHSAAAFRVTSAALACPSRAPGGQPSAGRTARAAAVFNQ